MKIFIINGPNLNMLGLREPEIYGNLTLDDINKIINDYCKQKNIEAAFFQSNSEGELIEKLHSLFSAVDYIIFNPGAFTHTSIALYDAIKSINIPVIEVHLSNIHSRTEEFRKKSVTVGSCIGQITGFGYHSYILAVEAAIQLSTK